MTPHLTKEELITYLKKKNRKLITRIEEIEKTGKGSKQNAQEQLRYNDQLLLKYE